MAASINHQNIIHSISFLRDVLTERLDIYFGKTESDEIQYPPWNIISDDSYLYNLIDQIKISIEEYIILLLALVPHLHVDFFENIIQQYLPQGGDFTAIGGVKGNNHRGMLPTGETAQFIIAGTDIAKRLHIQKLLLNESVLVKENMVWIDSIKDGEPVMSGRLIIANDVLGKLLTGEELPPKFSSDFPAKRVFTAMDWSDLVLNDQTLKQIQDIQLWLQYNKALMNDEVLRKKIKPGYRVLFYGPPGTGKTLTASLLGKQFGKDVYRVDLSSIVSKYIGETEKNLEKIFAKAENKDWILFFDEADALFGKRTNVQSSHDRYANQEVSYLLQRVEDFPGLLILASNFKNNMDEAFLRRFHNIVHFPAPDVFERRMLWQKTLPQSLKLEGSIDLQQLSEKYELNGSAILNVVHDAALKSVARNDPVIKQDDLIEAIRKELRKDERTMN